MQTKTIKPFVLPALAGIAICLVIGILGSLVTMPAVESLWFTELAKPIFQPPNWLFAPVWTILYIMMGIAAGIVAASAIKERDGKLALVFFGIQLVLNLLWSFLFFGAQNLLLASIDILALWGFLLATILMFFKIHKAAGWMMIPYILWVSFASVLMLTLFFMN